MRKLLYFKVVFGSKEAGLSSAAHRAAAPSSDTMGVQVRGGIRGGSAVLP